MEFSPKILLDDIPALTPGARLWVAYSGGLDSHVLLHALARGPTAGLAGGAGGRCPLVAVHVDHGLAGAAPEWARHCAAACADLGVALEVVRVDARPGRGESPEAAARAARYRVLTALIAPGDVVVTGHHQDDQAETVLLRLLRGAGPRGLAAMAPCRPLGAGWLCRPLLAVPREALRRYAEAWGLAWVEDPSNTRMRHPRNRLRHQVLPLVQRHWPGVSRTLARVAAHQARAAALLDEMAATDLARVAGALPGTLNAVEVARLDPDHARNLLHYWLRLQELPPPGERHLEQVLRAVAAGPDRGPRVAWPGGEVRRYRGLLHALAPLAPVGARRERAWDLGEALDLGHGVLTAEPVVGAGMRVPHPGQAVRVGLRRGGERCRPADRAHGQTLKRLFQEREVAPWLRDRLPLVWIDGALAAVADRWTCAPFIAGPGEAGVHLRWRERPARAAADD